MARNEVLADINRRRALLHVWKKRKKQADKENKTLKKEVELDDLSRAISERVSCAVQSAVRTIVDEVCKDRIVKGDELYFEVMRRLGGHLILLSK
ncbi:MAG: hypothetical protein ACRD5H_00905 [Nitrososphaerales archaeon]